MKTFNVIVINLHTRLTVNLYYLAFQLIIWDITVNIAKFYIVPSIYCSYLTWFFYKSISLYSNLLLATLTIANSLLICWFTLTNVGIVSDKFEIWSQKFLRLESTITFPHRLIICWTRSAFFSALIALRCQINWIECLMWIIEHHQ